MYIWLYEIHTETLVFNRPDSVKALMAELYAVKYSFK